MGHQLMSIDFINPATFGGAVVFAIAFLGLAWILSRGLRFTAEHVLSRKYHVHIDRTRIRFSAQLAQMAVYIFAFIFYVRLVPALSNLGNAWLASVGVITIIAGLAAQNTLGNLIAGISLLLYRPFEVGDRLQISAPTGLETGVVESLNLGYTLLRTDDNRHVVVPNNTMANQTSINLTRDNPEIICSIPFLITLDSDLNKARAILLELAKKNTKTQKVCGCPVTQLDGFGVVLTLGVWCANSVIAADLKCDLLEEVKKRFASEGIKFPTVERAVVSKS